MNEFIQRLSDATVENVKKTHTLLDKVISGMFEKYPEGTHKFKQGNMTVESTISDELSFRITRDVDSGTVLVRAFTLNEVLAECVVDIFSNYSSNYKNIIDPKLKREIFDLFESYNFINLDNPADENISDHASDGTPVEKVSE